MSAALIVVLVGYAVAVVGMVAVVALTVRRDARRNVVWITAHEAASAAEPAEQSGPRAVTA